MYNKHFQTHRFFSSYNGRGSSSTVKINSGKSFETSNVIPVDQFFSQPHNMVRGFVDTSPTVFDNPQAAAHLHVAQQEPSLPADMPVNEIHDMCISKDCQTLSELQQLKKLRPSELDFYDKEESSNVSDVVTPNSTES